MTPRSRTEGRGKRHHGWFDHSRGSWSSVPVGAPHESYDTHLRIVQVAARPSIYPLACVPSVTGYLMSYKLSHTFRVHVSEDQVSFCGKPHLTLRVEMPQEESKRYMKTEGSTCADMEISAVDRHQIEK